MTMAFNMALENLGRGLARGSQISGEQREKYDQLLAQRRRDLQYQNFQIYLQEKSQTFQEAQAAADRQIRQEQFNKTYKLQEAAANRAEREMAQRAKQHKDMLTFQEWQKKRSMEEAAYKYFQDDINALNRTLQIELSKSPMERDNDLIRNLRGRILRAEVEQEDFVKSIGGPDMGLRQWAEKEKTTLERKKEHLAKIRANIARFGSPMKTGKLAKPAQPIKQESKETVNQQVSDFYSKLPDRKLIEYVQGGNEAARKELLRRSDEKLGKPSNINFDNKFINLSGKMKTIQESQIDSAFKPTR